MRHGKRINHLGRTASHRKAMLSNMAASLLVNKRINTTLAKAKELRRYVEPLITKAKNDTTHARRVIFSYLRDKESVNALFNEVVDRVANRPGGYTRIIKLGSRLGDNAEMAMIELVDFNELLIQEAEPKKAKTRRSRRGSKDKSAVTADAEAKAEKKEKDDKAKPSDNNEIVEGVTEQEEGKEEVKAEVIPEEKAEIPSDETTEVKTKADNKTEKTPEKAKESGEKEKENKDDGESNDKK